MPAAQKQKRGDAGDRHHVGVLGHEEAGEFHAAVFGMEAGNQFVFGFRQVEREAICFSKTGDHENHEAENLREWHLENIPAGDESQIVTRLAGGDIAKAQMIRQQQRAKQSQA